MRALLLVPLMFAVGGAGGQTVPISIAFFDAKSGLLSTLETIEATVDGGRTWHVVRRGGPFDLVEAGETVWAQRGRLILRSQDRGRTWKRLAAAPGAVSFATPLLGWSVHERSDASGTRVATLFETVDGGWSWRRVGRVCGAGAPFAESAAVSRVSARLGWLLCAGQPGAGQMLKAVYRTADGGKTWQMRACACVRPDNRGRLSSAGYAGSIHFTRRGFGILLQHRGSPLSITTDGGRTWRDAGAAEFEAEYGHAAALVSGRTVYALVGPPSHAVRLVVTRNGGRSWRVVRRWSKP